MLNILAGLALTVWINMYPTDHIADVLEVEKCAVMYDVTFVSAYLYVVLCCYFFFYLPGSVSRMLFAANVVKVLKQKDCFCRSRVELTKQKK